MQIQATRKFVLEMRRPHPSRPSVIQQILLPRQRVPWTIKVDGPPSVVKGMARGRVRLRAKAHGDQRCLDPPLKAERREKKRVLLIVRLLVPAFPSGVRVFGRLFPFIPRRARSSLGSKQLYSMSSGKLSPALFFRLHVGSER